MPIAPYPRSGEPLAPATLRSVLEVAVPRQVTKRFRRFQWTGIQLADLDATSWERFGERVCQVLAAAIVAQVAEAIKSPLAAIHRQRLPTTERAMSLDDLLLGRRAYNCLGRAGWHENVQRLGELTIGDLLKRRHFGACSLVDLLVALEGTPNVPGPLLPRPGELSWIQWAHASELRLPHNADEWTFPDLPANMAVEELKLSPCLLRGLRKQGLGKSLSSWSGYPILKLLELPGVGPYRLHWLLGRVDTILHPSQQAPLADLATEILDVFLPLSRRSATKTTRNRRVFLRLYGLDGRGGATLAAIGRAEGVQRQRIRQLCQLRPRSGGATPRLDSALQAIAELAPAPAAEVEVELLRRGLVSQRMPLKSLIRFAHALRHPFLFQIIRVGPRRERWVVGVDLSPHLLGYLERVARWYVNCYGVACLADVVARVAALTAEPVDPALAQSLLSTLADFCWLDEASGWFWLRSCCGNMLLRKARKIMAVAGPLPVDAFVDCLRRLPCQKRRHLPLRRFSSLPPHILNNFCRGMPGVRLEGDVLVADPPLDWRVVLSAIERAVVGIFVEYGPLLRRNDLKNYARQRGIKEKVLSVTLCRLPAIRRRADGYYYLCGSRAQEQS